eukprot:9367070-Pyramimonas_sp.AAC.1
MATSMDAKISSSVSSAMSEVARGFPALLRELTQDLGTKIMETAAPKLLELLMPILEGRLLKVMDVVGILQARLQELEKRSPLAEGYSDDLESLAEEVSVLGSRLQEVEGSIASLLDPARRGPCSPVRSNVSKA